MQEARHFLQMLCKFLNVNSFGFVYHVTAWSHLPLFFFVYVMNISTLTIFILYYLMYVEYVQYNTFLHTTAI